MPYSSYVDENGQNVYFDIDTGQTYGSSPPAGVGQQFDTGTQTYADGTSKYVNLNDPSDLANLRQNYTQLMAHPEWSDEQVRQYVRQATGGGNFQLGNNAPGLTSKVDNKTQGWEKLAIAGIGGLAGLGLTGVDLLGAGEALGGAGAGAGGGAAELGGTLPTWAGGVADTTLGSGVAGTGLGGASLAGTGLTTAEGVGTGFAAGGGALGGAGLPGVAVDTLPAWAGGEGGTSLGGASSGLPNLPPGAQSVISKLLSGQSLTSDDLAKLAGVSATTLAGLFGADATRSANNSAADKFLNLGAPARAEFNRTLQPGFDPSSMPGYTSAIDSVMNSYLRKASTGGNPFSNPGVSMEANKYVTDSTALPALNNYRNTLVNAGNTGVGGAAVPNAAAASAPNQATNAVAGGLGSLSAQPAQDYSQVLRQILNLGQAVV